MGSRANEELCSKSPNTEGKLMNFIVLILVLIVVPIC